MRISQDKRDSIEVGLEDSLDSVDSKLLSFHGQRDIRPWREKTGRVVIFIRPRSFSKMDPLPEIFDAGGASWSINTKMFKSLIIYKGSINFYLRTIEDSSR